MYKYKYEKVSCNLSGFGLLNGNVYGISDYQTIIEEKALNGFHYVGFLPTKQRGTGHIEEIVLIFEKQIKK